eukprot:sb/3473026/
MIVERARVERCCASTKGVMMVSAYSPETSWTEEGVPLEVESLLSCGISRYHPEAPLVTDAHRIEGVIPKPVPPSDSANSTYRPQASFSPYRNTDMLSFLDSVIRRLSVMSTTSFLFPSKYRDSRDRPQYGEVDVIIGICYRPFYKGPGGNTALGGNT